MLYLDVDGVLNPDEEAPDTWKDWRRKKWLLRMPSDQAGGWASSGMRQTLLFDWSPSMVEAIMDVTGGAISWLTSWNAPYRRGSYAHELLEPLFGWPELATVAGRTYEGHDPNPETGQWWKLTNLKRWLLPFAPDHGPFVWIDDDFAFEPDAIEWVEANGGLAIITNPKVGLVPEHINQIGHFLGR